MRVEILEALRKEIEAFLPSFTHLIGVKDNIKQSDYPFVSYVYTGEQPDGHDETVLSFHIYFGILQKDFDDNQKVYLGQTQIINVIEAIKSLLYSKRAFAPFVIDSWIERIATDGGLQHPRYEGEIILKVRVLDKLPEPQVLVKKISVFDAKDNLISEVQSDES